MRPHLRALGLAGTIAAVGLLVPAIGPSPVGAQLPRGVQAVDPHYGVRLRHAPAYRGRLDVPCSSRADNGLQAPAPLWSYHYFDHPVPSYQFFQTPQVFRWSWGVFPGLDRHSCGYAGPPAYGAGPRGRPTCGRRCGGW